MVGSDYHFHTCRFHRFPFHTCLLHNVCTSITEEDKYPSNCVRRLAPAFFPASIFQNLRLSWEFSIGVLHWKCEMGHLVLLWWISTKMYGWWLHWLTICDLGWNSNDQGKPIKKLSLAWLLVSDSQLFSCLEQELHFHHATLMGMFLYHGQIGLRRNAQNVTLVISKIFVLTWRSFD